MKRLWISQEDFEALKNGELILEAKGQPLIQVAPVDTVWFAENVLGVKLMDYQKKIIRAMEQMKNPKIIRVKGGFLKIIDAIPYEECYSSMDDVGTSTFVLGYLVVYR